MTRLRIIFWRTFYFIVNPWRRSYWRIVKPKTRGVKFLVTKEDTFLLVRLSYGPKHWTLPGGAVNKGEAHKDAALRELQEETGLTCRNPQFFYEYYSELEHKRNTIQCFAGEAEHMQCNLDPVEIAEADWFTADTLPEPRSPRTDEIMAAYTKHSQNV